MKEGSTEAPIRHPLDWQNPDFLDQRKIEDEMERVFDICHGCRRCFNLCDSFPRLFDLIDESETGELDSVDRQDYKPVVEACTLCDLCFMTKCPYVPPHEFNLDFPHLMLRYRAAELARGGVPFTRRQLAETDRNGRLAGMVAPLANWATAEGNGLTRPLLEATAGIHRDAALPKFHGDTFVKQARAAPPPVNAAAPAHGRKAVLYATCFANYNDPEIGRAAQAVLARNGVETEVVYPACCGMPMWEQGNIAQVAENARKVAAEMRPWLDKGYDVVALVPSCALMLKFEWPLALPDDADVKRLSGQTFDISEYVVDIARKEGLADGLGPLEGGVMLHFACHARAQNMGPKGADMLRLLPDTEIGVIERCSGHGGAMGVMKDFFETGLKVGKPVARQARKSGKAHVVSECPLASDHIRQGMERVDGEGAAPKTVAHPILLFARAYGVSL